jgi:hypothetical protein
MENCFYDVSKSAKRKYSWKTNVVFLKNDSCDAVYNVINEYIFNFY